MGGTPKGTKASTRDAERSPPVPEHRCGCPPPFLGGQAPPATPVASTLWNLGGLEGREARVLELVCGVNPLRELLRRACPLTKSLARCFSPLTLAPPRGRARLSFPFSIISLRDSPTPAPRWLRSWRTCDYFCQFSPLSNFNNLRQIPPPGLPVTNQHPRLERHIPWMAVPSAQWKVLKNRSPADLVHVSPRLFGGPRHACCASQMRIHHHGLPPKRPRITGC